MAYENEEFVIVIFLRSFIVRGTTEITVIRGGARAFLFLGLAFLSYACHRG